MGLMLDFVWFDSPQCSSGGPFGGEAVPKYRTLWRHICLRQIGPLIEAARGGVHVVDGPNFRGASDSRATVSIPYVCLAFILLALLNLEANIRARWRYAPGLCQKCGYDVRSNNTLCSECGTEIVTADELNAKAAIRRRVFRFSVAVTILILLLHVATGLTVLSAGHEDRNARPA